MVRCWVLAIFLAIVFGATCSQARILDSGTSCESKILSIAEWRPLLHEIHSEFLAPEVAQLATEVRLKWIELALSDDLSVNAAESMKQIPVPHFSRAIRSLIHKSKIYFEWNREKILQSKDERAPAALQSLQKAYAEVERIREDVETRGFANYYEMRFLTELASQIGSHLDRIKWNFAIRRPFEEPGDADGFADFFMAPISIGSIAGIHLGFRTLNDVSSVLVGFVEIPDLVPGQTVSVDGAQFDFGYFIDHDIVHARDTFAIAPTSLPRKDWPQFYYEALRRRTAVYRSVRQVIDRIEVRRQNVLAEGIWFGLDHEYNLAYRNKNWLALPTPSYFFASESIEEILLQRFRDRSDLGQAFKNSDWIDRRTVVDFIQQFQAMASHNFLAVRE